MSESITLKMEKSDTTPSGRQRRPKGRSVGAKVTAVEKPIPIRQHEGWAQINRRFFQALNYAIDNKMFTMYSFCKKNRINDVHIYNIEKEVDTSTVPALYLSYLVADANISAHWLLTGEGEMIRY